MRFYHVLEALLEQNATACREEWESTHASIYFVPFHPIMVRVGNAAHSLRTTPHLVRMVPGLYLTPWTPSAEDLVAHDWHINFHDRASISQDHAG